VIEADARTAARSRRAFIPDEPRRFDSLTTEEHLRRTDPVEAGIGFA
jgi:hypothetical protein